MTTSAVSNLILYLYINYFTMYDLLLPLTNYLRDNLLSEWLTVVCQPDQQTAITQTTQIMATNFERWCEYSDSRRQNWQARLQNWVEQLRADQNLRLLLTIKPIDKKFYTDRLSSKKTLKKKTTIIDKINEQQIKLALQTWFDAKPWWWRSRAVTFLDEAYPISLGLLEIADPPPVLWANHSWGNWTWPSVRLAVIGSRQMSTYGQLITHSFVGELVKTWQVGIISGCARGVDMYSHQTAIKNGGLTVGVLGGGFAAAASLNATQRRLAQQRNALLISEFPPEMSPQAWTFVKRNRLISAFSQAVLVVEAKESSGTLNTVNHALEQGKDVFVIPQSLWNVNYQGIVNLVNDGARLVTSAGDLMLQLSLSWTNKNKESDKTLKLIINKKMVGTSPKSVLKTEDKSVNSELILSSQEQQMIDQIMEKQGQLPLADLLINRPPTCSERNWQKTWQSLLAKQVIKQAYGVVHLKNVIKS